jgi:hypothetical protein
LAQPVDSHERTWTLKPSQHLELHRIQFVGSATAASARTRTPTARPGETRFRIASNLRWPASFDPTERGLSPGPCYPTGGALDAPNVGNPSDGVAERYPGEHPRRGAASEIVNLQFGAKSQQNLARRVPSRCR